MYLVSELEIKGRKGLGEMSTRPTTTVITPIVDEVTNTNLGLLSKLTRWLGMVGVISYVETSKLERINYGTPSQRHVHRSPSFTMMADLRVRNFSR